MANTNQQLRVLVVDDEKAIRHFLRVSLEGRGYRVFEAGTGTEGLDRIMADRPDLVILDLGLPDMEGTAFITALREWSPIPVIVLSVRDREFDKITALDLGANDYVTKPFGVGELTARMRAVLRTVMNLDENTVLCLGESLKVDLTRRRVLLNGEEISLTPTEYDLLRVLVMNRGKVMTHHQLLRQVWGEAYVEERHLLQVNMSNLRRKIESDPSRPRFLMTEPRVGYRLRDEYSV